MADARELEIRSATAPSSCMGSRSDFAAKPGFEPDVVNIRVADGLAELPLVWAREVRP
jgi:hypothetical protein